MNGRKGGWRRCILCNLCGTTGDMVLGVFLVLINLSLRTTTSIVKTKLRGKTKGWRAEVRSNSACLAHFFSWPAGRSVGRELGLCLADL